MSGFDKEKWRAELAAVARPMSDDESEDVVLVGDVWTLIERAYAEGRADGCEAASKVVDEILDRGWPDTGDRPSSPPAVLLTVATRLSALAAARKGTP